MERISFEQFILENLYNLWKKHGTSQVKPLQALIDEYGPKEEKIGKPLRKLISAGLVNADTNCAWITEEGIAKADLIVPSSESAVTGEEKAPVSIGANFLKNFEQTISKSDLSMPEKEMWLNGIKQINHNPLLLKAVEDALEATK